MYRATETLAVPRRTDYSKTSMLCGSCVTPLSTSHNSHKHSQKPFLRLIYKQNRRENIPNTGEMSSTTNEQWHITIRDRREQ